MIDLLLLQIIIVFIIDISGVIDNIKSLLMKTLTKGRIGSNDYRLKPIDCSLCTTFWAGLIYLLITSTFSIGNMAYVCLLAFLTPVTKELYYTIYDILIKLLRWINS